jgi:hypothetical protein
MHDAISEGVDLGGDAVGLIEDADVALEREKAINVSAGPGVDRLVIVACDVGLLCAFDELTDESPLELGKSRGKRSGSSTTRSRRSVKSRRPWEAL